MPDEITSNPVPISTPAPQAPEILNPTPSETVIAQDPVEPPTEAVPASVPTPEPPSGHLGGNDPIEPAPESTPPTPPETVIEPTQAPTPEPNLAPETTPTQVVTTVVAPIVANTITHSFTKSMRELFTKALNARQNRKRTKLDRILTLFAKQTIITNDEVEKLLHVSDSTATRYLATLEKEGKIKQNIKKGQATSYSRI